MSTQLPPQTRRRWCRVSHCNLGFSSVSQSKTLYSKSHKANFAVFFSPLLGNRAGAEESAYPCPREQYQVHVSPWHMALLFLLSRRKRQEGKGWGGFGVDKGHFSCKTIYNLHSKKIEVMCSEERPLGVGWDEEGTGRRREGEGSEQAPSAGCCPHPAPRETHL